MSSDADILALGDSARADWQVGSWGADARARQAQMFWGQLAAALTPSGVSDAERVTSAISVSAESIIDSFMREYQKRIQSFLQGTSGFDYSHILDSSPGDQSEFAFEHPPTPDLVDYFLNEVVPTATRSKAHLAVTCVHSLKAMKDIGQDLLDLVDSDPASEERENWLYSIGRQYWARLIDEGLFQESAAPKPESRSYVLAA
jgi:hypothetical protein